MKRFKFAIFLLSIVLSSSSLLLQAKELDDASSLLQFKKSSIQQDPKNFLLNWTNATSICSWTGVICSNLDTRIHSLNLSNMGLVGRLDLDFLMSMPDLVEVDLHGNLFYGNLSSSSSSSSTSCNIQKLDISSNNFSEPLHKSFLTPCFSLVSLNLSRNMIPGADFSFMFSSVQVVDLSRNRISSNEFLNFSLSNCHNINYLNLSDNKLIGNLPETISSSCSNLTILDLSFNLISGRIPSNFVSNAPTSLQHLDLSHNNFSGDFSKYNFGECKQITTIDISSNGLNGTSLPMSLTNCKLLETLALSANNFSGQLPTFWTSLSNLKHLSLSDNKISGQIPSELGQTCETLIELDLSGNQLIGELPSTFTGCRFLERLDLGDNQLSGNFVEEVISTITTLKFLYLPFNNLSGSLPLKSLTNCTLLEVIDLSSNDYSGEIPTGFGFCKSVPKLTKLMFPNNLVTGNIPSEFGSCLNLKSVDFSFNYLNGQIPSEVWSLPKLTDMIMWANNLEGKIPENICTDITTSNFEMLILSYNNLSGTIPESFANCTNLIWVSLSGNKFTGKIPERIGNLKKLAILQLGNNVLSGSIPPDIGNCESLIWLDLTNNSLSGPIPGTIAAQTGLIVPGMVSGKHFAFLRNEAGNICPGAGVLFEFEGIRPERLANFPLANSCPPTRIYTGTTVYAFSSNGSIIYMDLSYNLLNGSIPVEFGPMEFLQVLNLGHNRLTGTIPTSFGGMKMLGVLDLSHNRLSGSIPGDLVRLSFLNDMDVSYNNLSGPIPTGGQFSTFLPSRYDHNSGLCGVPLARCGSGGSNSNSNSNSGGRKGSFGNGSMIVGIVFAFLIIFTLLVAIYRIRKYHKNGEGKNSYIQSLSASFGINNSGGGEASSWKFSTDPVKITLETFDEPLRNLTFAHLLEATNGFSPETLIGSGGFGDVYKAKLGDGSTVAVKKLVRFAGQGDREFTSEMETIGKIKHRNLVPLLGYCRANDERILVYEYMRHGSLDVSIQTRRGSLDWATRKKIAIGSARGLAFLHHSCVPHIIHRDMKSSNVLLDENFNARVSDFGMARLMNALDTHLSVSTLAGTPGYVPPEYYQSFRCTTKGDVYSYGVVLLELLTGRKPIDPLEFGDNNLVGWAKNLAKENRWGEIVDGELMGKGEGEGEVYKCLKIAFECLDDRPFKRPTMIQVMAMFKEIDQADFDTEFSDAFSVGKCVIDETKEKGS